MGTSRKYVVAVAFLFSLALVFGVLGTVAPPLVDEGLPVQPQQGSPSESVGHFQNPPTYDSGWVNITDRQGEHVTLRHDLNTTQVIVDITGKQSLNQIGGDFKWNETYGGNPPSGCANSVIQTADGGYALAGYIYPFNSQHRDVCLFKADSAGNVEWSRTYGRMIGSSIVDDVAYSLIQTDDGGFAIAGSSYADPWLIRTDATGRAEWNKTYRTGGITSQGYAYSLIKKNDGGFAMAGLAFLPSRSAESWLIKTDALGNHLWNKTYGGTGTDRANSVVQTGDGGYALAGETSSYGLGTDFWLVKTDSSGNAQWNRTYGEAGGMYEDRAYCLVQTSDGGFAVAGHSFVSWDKFMDFLLVRTDSDGNQQWNRTYGKVYPRIHQSRIL